MFTSETGGQISEVDWCAPEHIALQLQTRPQWAWLDSSTGGRFSYLCADPIWACDIDPAAALSDIWPKLTQTMTRLMSDPFPDLPDDLDIPPFRGGFMALLSYEAGNLFENTADLSPYRVGECALPRLNISFYGSVLAFDHAAQKCFAIATGLSADQETAAADDKTRHRQAGLDLEKWHQLTTQARQAAPDLAMPAQPITRNMTSNFSRTSYMQAVQTIIDHIRAGDIFQANLSQQFSGQFAQPIDGLTVYRHLRRKSPAPHAAYAQFPGWEMISASPEQFLSITGSEVSSRPIKGTAPRHTDPEEDQHSAQTLLASDKDRAENIMIVDLLRNDLARSCRDHSINVSDLCRLESHSNVHHLVSTITGQLATGRTALDVLATSFPGGSITGAPKIRAMDIIAEIEQTPRGPYCGSFGYIGLDGATQFNILIRTLVKSDLDFQFSAGGGITAQSDPAVEYQETLDKAAHIAEILGIDLEAFHA